MVAEEDPNAVLERIAYPQTRIVSLTITEKGYCREPATGYLRWDDPDIEHDLGNPERPRSTIGILVYGLALRRERGLPPVTLLSCDNLRGNGDILRTLVLAFALRVDVALTQWIDANCTFPNSMLDRIVPRTEDGDRERIARRLGVEDAWPVVGEPYLNWVIEDKFAAGRPAWETQGGATFVRSAAPYERLKLRMADGPHSALAYLGAAMGKATVAEALEEPALRRFVEDMMRLEIAPTLKGIPGAGLEEYRLRFLARAATPALRLSTWAVGRGPRKRRSAYWTPYATVRAAATTSRACAWPWRPGCTTCAARTNSARAIPSRIRWRPRWAADDARRGRVRAAAPSQAGAAARDGAGRLAGVRRAGRIGERRPPDRAPSSPCACTARRKPQALALAQAA